jgi:hypothetical protein
VWRHPSTHGYFWFTQWITEGYSVRQLSQISGLSFSALRRSLKYWLERPPATSSRIDQVSRLICDGTFLEHRTGIYAVMNAQTNALVHAEFDVPEGATELTRVYQALKARGVTPVSATIDGNPQQMQYLRTVWPSVKLQRCTVHVQRQGLSWCRRSPKRTDARHLREIFLDLSVVETRYQARLFRSRVRDWEHRFGPAIDQSTDRGWVFQDIVRARSMLLKALPDLFRYVRDPRIPKSTNALEGYFSRLKEHYRLHRGLSPKNKLHYFKWWFALKPI